MMTAARRLEIDRWHARISAMADPVALGRMRAQVLQALAATPRTPGNMTAVVELIEGRNRIDRRLAALGNPAGGETTASRKSGRPPPSHPRHLEKPEDEFRRSHPMAKLEYHPLANLFPMITDPKQLAVFRASIAADGVCKPVVLLDGKILDGRNRYEAAIAAGQSIDEIPTRDFGSTHLDGDDPLRFVMRENAERRHLTDDQRRRIAAKIATMGSGRAGGEVSPLAKPDGVTRAEATVALNTDKAGVDRAKSVYAHGTPELQRAMDADQVSVRTAADVAKLPPERQRQVVAAGPEAMREAAGGVRHAAKAQRALKAAESTSVPAAVGDKHRDPESVNRALRFVGAFEDFADALRDFDVEGELLNLSPSERRRVVQAIQAISDIHKRIQKRLQPVRKPSAGNKHRPVKARPARPVDDVPQIEAYSIDWWAVLIRKAVQGASVNFMLRQAAIGNGWDAKPGEAPRPEETEVLERVELDSDEFKEAERAFRERTGKSLPRPEAPAEVWLPKRENSE